MELNFKIQKDKLIAGSVLEGNSGNVNTYVCNFEILDNKDYMWLCVFKKGDTAYKQVIKQGKCVIPKEVLENQGDIKIGCYGVWDNARVSTNWLTFNVKDGAYSQATAPEEPTPDVWEELVMNSLPYIGETGNWYVYDMKKKEHVDSGKPSDSRAGEKWELLQSKEVAEEDGELSNLIITFPEGYREFVVFLDKKESTATNNTVIYPSCINDKDKSVDFPFWDFYEGKNPILFSINFSSMMLSENNALKMEGICDNVSFLGKHKYSRTSGWIEGYKRWKGVRFSTRLPLGSKYRVWGYKE